MENKPDIFVIDILRREPVSHEGGRQDLFPCMPLRRKRLRIREVRGEVRIEQPELSAALAGQAKDLLLAKGY